MRVGVVLRGRPVRDPDLDECAASTLFGPAGRLPGLHSHQKRCVCLCVCLCVCADSLMCACFCCVSGSYCCCRLSWEVGLTTFLLGSLEPSRNGHVPIHMRRLSSLLALFYLLFSRKLLFAKPPLCICIYFCLCIYIFMSTIYI